MAPSLERTVESSRLELYSSLSPSDCVTQLSKAIDQERLIGLSCIGSHSVTGRIDGTTFRIRKRIDYRNSFRVFLTASMQSHGNGTLIQGEFAVSGFTRAFMTVWFVVAAVIGAIVFEVALITLFFGTSSQRGPVWVGLVGPLLLLAIGILFVRVGERSARVDAGFLTDFLREVLQANEEIRPVPQK